MFFWYQSEARTEATVWNWSGKTLSPGALLAVLYFSFVAYFSACLDFPSHPLSAPGSPRMQILVAKAQTSVHVANVQVWSVTFRDRPLSSVFYLIMNFSPTPTAKEHCTVPYIIPTPKWSSTPKWSPTLKWSPNRLRNDPQLILGTEWYPRTLDLAKCTTLI